MESIEEGVYSQGLAIDGSKISTMNAKTDTIAESNKLTKMLEGGLVVKLNLDKKMKSSEIKTIIEKASLLISSFRPVMYIAVCGNCGYKDEKLTDKCPNCKSTYIL